MTSSQSDLGGPSRDGAPFGDEAQSNTARIGNDLVDLREPGAREQHLNVRFLERVFTPAERAAIATAREPALLLWAIWAAKEAAFKIARKADPIAVFAHAKYEVPERTLVRLAKTSRLSTGRIRAPGFEARVKWRIRSDRIECLAIEDPERRTQRLILRSSSDLGLRGGEVLLSAAELQSAHSSESQAVRIFAKRIAARELQLPVERLTVIRPAASEPGVFGPPELHLDGQRLPEVDLTLSHDGRWVSVGLAISR